MPETRRQMLGKRADLLMPPDRPGEGDRLLQPALDGPGVPEKAIAQLLTAYTQTTPVSACGAVLRQPAARTKLAV